MADIEQVRSEVNTACSRYREDLAKMEQAANEMSMYQEQANQADQDRDVYMQAQANYFKAQSRYMQAESDLDNVRNYLELVRTQMENAADVFQTKIFGFNQSLQILEGASGNMFASAANTQVSKLQISRNQYQENLNIAQAVIEQISGTIDDQGTARVLDMGLRR